jgi:hypothetical protein
MAHPKWLMAVCFNMRSLNYLSGRFPRVRRFAALHSFKPQLAGFSRRNIACFWRKRLADVSGASHLPEFFNHSSRECDASIDPLPHYNSTNIASLEA